MRCRRYGVPSSRAGCGWRGPSPRRARLRAPAAQWRDPARRDVRRQAIRLQRDLHDRHVVRGIHVQQRYPCPMVEPAAAVDAGRDARGAQQRRRRASRIAGAPGAAIFEARGAQRESRRSRGSSPASHVPVSSGSDVSQCADTIRIARGLGSAPAERASTRRPQRRVDRMHRRAVREEERWQRFRREAAGGAACTAPPVPACSGGGLFCRPSATRTFCTAGRASMRARYCSSAGNGVRSTLRCADQRRTVKR